MSEPELPTADQLFTDAMAVLVEMRRENLMLHRRLALLEKVNAELERRLREAMEAAVTPSGKKRK